jgi:DnaK suppressor protein
MTKNELSAFRKTLEAKLNDLANGNKNRDALVIESSPDELDRIQNSQERELAIGALDRNATLLREVRAALARVKAGTFGICAGCDEEINPKRLAAIPWASACVVCQEAAEREQTTPWEEVDSSLGIAA